MIRFRVDGVPKSMQVGSSVAFKRNGVTHHFQKRRNADWGTLVGYVGRQHAPEQPLTGALSFTATFYMPRPKDVEKKPNALPIRRPDVDGLVHKLTDQFLGVFYADDSQIVDFLVYKRYVNHGESPGVEITVAHAQV